MFESGLDHAGSGISVQLERKVIESVSNGVTISDATLPDLPLIYVNPAFEIMTGYSRDEVIGRSCRFLQRDETLQPGLTTLREAIRESREALCVLRNYRKDGVPFWNELYMSPLRDDQGRLTHFIGIQNDVTARVELQQRVSFLAHYDDLTGLATRRLLFDRLQHAILRASRKGIYTALLFFDLNNFKHVNDVFGHHTGDELLRVIASRLRMEARECDTVGRLGGDEFVIVIADLEDEAAIPVLLERMRCRISETVVIHGHEFHPSASVGSALYPRDARDPADLLKVADLAMYANKHGARHTQGENASKVSGRSVPSSSAKRTSR